jgi:SAM-dependent methyltransferase
MDLRVTALDYSTRVLAVAAKNTRRAQPIGAKGVSLLRADARRLPLAPGSVDFVISSMFLHHLPPDDVIALLAAAFRLARCGLVLSDLVRGRLPYLAFYAIAPVLARNRLTRVDGATSVRRAYTPLELRRLAKSAGLRGAQVIAHFPWRMTLVVDK